MTTRTQDYEGVPAGAAPASGNTISNGSTAVTTIITAGTGAGSIVGTQTAGEVIDGSTSAKLTATGTATAVNAQNTTGTTQAGVSTKRRWYAAPTANINEQVIRNTGGRSLSVSLLTNGKVKVSTNSADIYTTPSALTFPGVYTLASSVDTGTAAGNDGRAQFAIYDSTGALAGGMTAPVEFTGLSAVGAGAATSAVQAGKTDANALTATWTEIIDSWIVTDTYGLPATGGGANTPPAITAGATIVMTSGTTATVTFDATDTGPISSFQTPTVVSTADTAPTVGAPTLTGINTTHATASYPVSGLTPSDTTISTKAVDASGAASTVAASQRIIYTSVKPRARAVTLVGATMSSPASGTPLAAWNAWLANPYDASTNPSGVQPPVFVTSSPPAANASVTVDYQPLDSANVAPDFGQSWALTPDNSASITVYVDLKFSGVVKATAVATLVSTIPVKVGRIASDTENTSIGSGAVARSQPTVAARFA